MHSLCARAPALALVVFGLAGGCGDDEVDSDIDGSPEDAGGDASPGPDAENLCPGAITFEALVADAITGQVAFDVQVADVGGSAMTTSAPNGRAQLCLSSDADSTLRSSRADYLTRLDAISRDALASNPGQPYPLEVLSVAAADGLLDDLGAARDPADSILLVSVRSGGEALEGATIEIDVDTDGAFARDGSGAFAATATGQVAAGGTVLFANVPLTEGGRAAITLTPPDNFTGTCAGPPSVELEADGVTGAFFACQ